MLGAEESLAPVTVPISSTIVGSTARVMAIVVSVTTVTVRVAAGISSNLFFATTGIFYFKDDATTEPSHDRSTCMVQRQHVDYHVGGGVG